MDTFCNTAVNSLTELEGKEGKECKVGGIVASVEHRMTKTGRPFGKLILEDYHGKGEFMLWSDDYLKYKSFLMPGLFLFIEGNILRKSWGEQNLEFKIRNIDLLNELATKKVQGLALRFPVQSVTEDFINSLEKLCKKHSGKAALRMYLKDDYESIQKIQYLIQMNAQLFGAKAGDWLLPKLVETLSLWVLSNGGEKGD